MLEGIKLLIERMETNPEEFTGDLSYRWSNIMQDLAKHGPEFLDPEDMMALNLKVKEVRRKELNAKIMDEIATQKRLKRAQEEFDMKTGAQGATIAQSKTAVSAWWTEDAMKLKKQNEMLEQAQANSVRNKLWP
jgi:citrate synthase